VVPAPDQRDELLVALKPQQRGTACERGGTRGVSNGRSFQWKNPGSAC
jgi:hypothetical protein